MNGPRNRQPRVSVLSDVRLKRLSNGGVKGRFYVGRCVPSIKAQMAREMGVARGTLDRMIVRATRPPSGDVGRSLRVLLGLRPAMWQEAVRERRG